MPADAARRRIMRQASGWLMRWTDSVLPLATGGAERDRRRLMPLRVRIAGLLIAAGGFGPAAADQPDTVNAVTPGGPGVLTQMPRLAGDKFLPDLSPHQPAIPDRGRRYDHHLIRQSPQRVRVLPARIALKDDCAAPRGAGDREARAMIGDKPISLRVDGARCPQRVSCHDAGAP